MDPKTLFKISYGMYLVGANFAEKLNAQVANVVFQITAEPPCLAVALNKKNLTREYISNSKKFSVSILEQAAPMELIGKFGFKSGRDIDKFAGTKYKLGATGSPIVLENALAYFEAEVINQIEVVTHTIFIGRVVATEMLQEAEPMTYAYYHSVKGGRSSQNAPTYQKTDALAAGKIAPGASQTLAGGKVNMQKYVCKVCGYVYDPAVGDPDGGVKPGTAFADIPDSWVCPVCGADKSQFEILNPNP